SGPHPPGTRSPRLPGRCATRGLACGSPSSPDTRCRCHSSTAPPSTGPIPDATPPSIQNHPKTPVGPPGTHAGALVVGGPVPAAAVELALAAVVHPLRAVAAQVVDQLLPVALAAAVADRLEQRPLAQLAQLLPQRQGVLRVGGVTGPGVERVLAFLRA